MPVSPHRKPQCRGAVVVFWSSVCFRVRTHTPTPTHTPANANDRRSGILVLPSSECIARTPSSVRRDPSAASKYDFFPYHFLYILRKKNSDFGQPKSCCRRATACLPRRMIQCNALWYSTMRYALSTLWSYSIVFLFSFFFLSFDQSSVANGSNHIPAAPFRTRVRFRSQIDRSMSATKGDEIE